MLIDKKMQQNTILYYHTGRGDIIDCVIRVIKAAIETGETYLGLELGSTRIKAVLIDGFCTGSRGQHTWENKLVDGVWTYSLDEIWNGVRDCYKAFEGCRGATATSLGRRHQRVRHDARLYGVWRGRRRSVSHLAKYNHRPGGGGAYSCLDSIFRSVGVSRTCTGDTER